MKSRKESFDKNMINCVDDEMDDGRLLLVPNSCVMPMMFYPANDTAFLGAFVSIPFEEGAEAFIGFMNGAEGCDFYKQVPYDQYEEWLNTKNMHHVFDPKGNKDTYVGFYSAIESKEYSLTEFNCLQAATKAGILAADAAQAADRQLTTIILSSTAGAVGLLVCIGLILGKRRGWFNTANANGSAPTEATPLVNINNDDNNKKQKQSSSCFGLGLFATLLTAQSKEQSNKAFKV